MKLIIDIPNEKYNKIKEWEDNITDYQTTLTLYRAVRNGIPYEKVGEPFITECRDTAIKENLPLYFVYYEETGIFEAYITETKELFEKRRCSKHLSSYEFKGIATDYLDDYSNWKEYHDDNKV